MSLKRVRSCSAALAAALLASALGSRAAVAQAPPPKLYLTMEEALAASGPAPADCIDANGDNRCLKVAPLQYANVGESAPRYRVGRWYHCVTKDQRPVSCREPGSFVDAPLEDIAVLRVSPAPPKP